MYDYAYEYEYQYHPERAGEMFAVVFASLWILPGEIYVKKKDGF